MNYQSFSHPLSIESINYHHAGSRAAETCASLRLCDGCARCIAGLREPLLPALTRIGSSLTSLSGACYLHLPYLVPSPCEVSGSFAGQSDQPLWRVLCLERGPAH